MSPQTIAALLCLVTVGPLDPPTSQPTTKPSAQEHEVLSLPDRPWGLFVDMDDFKASNMELAPDETRCKLEGESKKAGGFLSIFLEPAEKPGDSKVCRKTYGKRLYGDPAEKEANVVTWEAGDLAAAEFEVTSDSGPNPIRHWNINGYLVHDSVWIDIHLSKLDPSEEDKEQMRAIVKSARIDKVARSTAQRRFFWASLAHRRHDYEGAARLYQKVLDSEKEKRTFDKVQWRILVDQLGMDYGISGDLKDSRRVLKYGIKEDPEYPLFYYNLACTYAEGGDLEKAMDNLEKAFERKANVNRLEELPDPREDSSFKKYRKTKQFKETLKKIDL